MEATRSAPKRPLDHGPYNKMLGARVKAARQLRKMRMEPLAAALDISHVTLTNIQCGRGCRSDTVPRLAVALGVSLDYLFGLTDDPSPAPAPQAEAGAPG